MASFSTETFTKHDDYMTPKHAWESIKQFIPKDKLIWEAFYGDGASGRYLKEMGLDVIHEQVDFFEHDLGEIIVSNPPFSDCKKIMKRLAELDKPFILILPSSKINTSYFRDTFKDKGIQLIIPRKRIHFDKMVDGKIVEGKSSCNFDCFYYCYKIGLDRDIVWME
jgi:hypothetical protein